MADEVVRLLKDEGNCTCAVVRAYQREWEIKTGRTECYVPMNIRCDVHYGEVPGQTPIPVLN